MNLLLDGQANLPEISPFYTCPIGCAELIPSSVYSTTMYNFEQLEQ